MRLKARQGTEFPSQDPGPIIPSVGDDVPGGDPSGNAPVNEPLPTNPTPTPIPTIETPTTPGNSDVPTPSGATGNGAGASATAPASPSVASVDEPDDNVEPSGSLPSNEPSESGPSPTFQPSQSSQPPSGTPSATNSVSVTPSFSSAEPSLSSSPTSSIDPSTSFSSPSLTSSLPPSTTFSSAETSTLTETLSASDSLTLTVSYTAIVVTTNGSIMTIYSAVPTSLNTDNPGGLDSERIGAIVGGIVSGVLILVGVLGLIWWRWKKRKEKDEWVASVAKGHHREFSRARLLDGEDMEEVGARNLPYRDRPAGDSMDSSPTIRSLLNMPPVRAAPSPLGMHVTGPRDSAQFSHNDSTPSLRLMRARGSETGSRFREEVWPPPGEKMVDPLSASSTVDLAHIVDQVMGPSPLSTPPEGEEPPAPSSSGHKRPDSPTLGMYSARYETTSPISESASPPPALDMKGVEGGATMVLSASSTAAKRHSLGELTVRNHSPDPFIDDDYEMIEESDYRSLKRKGSNSAAGLLDDDPFKAPTTPPRIISRSYESIPQEPSSPTSPTSPRSPNRLLGLPPGAAAPKRPSPLANLAAKYPSTPGTSTTDRHEWLDP